MDIHADFSAILDTRLQEAVASDPTSIAQIIWDVVMGSPAHALVLDAGYHFVRARTVTERPGSLRDFGYPPADLAPLGRANRESEPVLYCASTYDTALAETKSSVDDFVAVVSYRLTQTISLNRVGYSRAAFDAHGWQSDGEGVLSPDFGSELVTPVHNALNATIGRLFTAPVLTIEEYRLSSEIAAVFMSGDELAGIVYPTVSRAGLDHNFAIKPVVADVCLTPVAVTLEQVVRVVDGLPKCLEVDKSRSFRDDGSIDWMGDRGKTIQLPERFPPLTFKAFPWGWVAWDPSGQRIFPGKYGDGAIIQLGPDSAVDTVDDADPR